MLAIEWRSYAAAAAGGWRQARTLRFVGSHPRADSRESGSGGAQQQGSGVSQKLRV